MQVDETAVLEEQHYILAPSDLPAERSLVLKHNDAFGLFDVFGDIDSKARPAEGLFYRGTRFLSSCKLKFANGRPLLLSSTVRRDNVLLAVDLTNPDVYFEGRIFLQRGTLHIYRSQFLWNGTLYQRLRIRNFSRSPTEISLTLEFAADYADIFEVRGSKRERAGVLHEPFAGDGEVILSYEGLDGVLRRTIIRALKPPQVTFGSSMHYTLRLGPDEERCLEFSFVCENGGAAVETSDYRDSLNHATKSAERAEHLTCPVSTSNEQFNTWIARSRADLNMLLTDEPQGPYPYGGVPWFATPFGRDGIITALECLWTAPAIARGVLAFLSATQAREVNFDQDAEPGKILHEARDGEMAALGEIPFRRYYGSVDSTPLFLILAGAYYRRTGDLEFIRSIWPNIELALTWIDRYGDSDGDGFVEYYRKSDSGLVQQGWKDSADSVFHADGSLTHGPVALCEVQAYVYAAKIEVAAFAAALGQQEAAQSLIHEAQILQRKFEDEFWIDELGMYALALDGDKQPCKVRSSNAGQCLFSGIASAEHATSIARILTGERFYSGWGIRTIADGEARFNPMSYHNGSVWPHDNALIAAGMARYRMTALASKVMAGLFEAATFFDFTRLPELFCGFGRRIGKGPTSYPVACSPQAWSAASTFFMLQCSIGLAIDAMKKRITLTRPTLPPFLNHVRINQVSVGEASVDLLLFRSNESVAVTVERREGDVDVIVLH